MTNPHALFCSRWGQPRPPAAGGGGLPAWPAGGHTRAAAQGGSTSGDVQEGPGTSRAPPQAGAGAGRGKLHCLALARARQVGLQVGLNSYKLFSCCPLEDGQAGQPSLEDLLLQANIASLVSISRVSLFRFLTAGELDSCVDAMNESFNQSSCCCHGPGPGPALQADKLLMMQDFQRLVQELRPSRPSRGGKPRPSALAAGSGNGTADTKSPMEQVLKTFQVIMVSASIKPQALAGLASWMDTQPAIVVAPAPADHGLQTDPVAEGSPGPDASSGSCAEPGVEDSSSDQALVTMLPGNLTHLMLGYRMKEGVLPSLKRCIQVNSTQQHIPPTHPPTLPSGKSCVESSCRFP
jgi:hypothetical protein